jgi:hypothetical protein
VNLSISIGDKVGIIGDVNGAVGQKGNLALVQINIHELVGGLSNECPCDQILSFGKSDL